MKWALFTLFTLFITFSNAMGKGYTNWGIGPQVSFNVPDNSPGTYYANPDPALGLGVNGVVHFSLGNGGTISYNPVFDVWFRVDSWDYNASEYPTVKGAAVHNVKLVDWALNFNLFEARYYPPIKAKIKPYVGIGLASISIYSYSEDVNGAGDSHIHYGEDIDAGLGANIYVGAALELNKKHTPFFEFRGSGSNSAPNTFKMSIGLHINK